MMSNLNSSLNRPQLVWVIEPENKIRFRYISEGGSHGPLGGKTGKKTFPTLRLENYRGRKPILVRVRLYTEDKKEHVLEFKGKKDEGSKPFIQEQLQADNTVVFKDIKILSKKKDEIEEILMERKLSNLKDGMSAVVRAQFEKSYRKDVKERAKAILNSVRLYFEAFESGKPDIPLCSLFSDVICNQKAASKGDLRICRLSQCAGSWKGNDEIILLCEKVQKDNIKIKFFEMNENDEVIWEDYGIFSPIDVHYQVAIYFRTPPYRKNVEKTVYICLERDKEISEAREFTYKADEPSSKKRKLEPYQYGTELSSESIEPSESLSSMSVSSMSDIKEDSMSDFKDGSMNGASGDSPMSYNLPPEDSDLFDTNADGLLITDELLHFLNNDVYTSPFEDSLDLTNFIDDGTDGIPMSDIMVGQMDCIDGVLPSRNTDICMNHGLSGIVTGIDGIVTPRSTLISKNHNMHQIDGIVTPRSTNVCKNQNLDTTDIDVGLKNLVLKDKNERKTNEFVSDCLKGSLSKPQLQKILRSLLKSDSCGNSMLHIAVLTNRNILPILKLSKATNIMHVLVNKKNQQNETALHLATQKNRKEAVRMLLKCGSNPNWKDLRGNNCYHLAAKNNFPEVLEEINRFSRFPHEVTAFNDEGLTPMHIAIMKKNLYLFDLLKIHITNVNIMEKKAGRSLVHYAVDFQPLLLPTLLEMDDVDVNIQDFEGNTPLHNACARENVETVKKLLHFGANPCIKNFKSSFNSLDLENSEDALDCGQLPSDLTSDIEILQLLKVAEESEKSLNFYHSSSYDESEENSCQMTEKLSEYLDKEEKWKKLVPYYLESDMEDSLSLSPSPSKALLYYIKKNGQDNYLEGLKTVLELAGFKDAISILNE